MSFAAALVMIAQSATPAVADNRAQASAPVAESVTASVTILRPTRIAFDGEELVVIDKAKDQQAPQHRRDAAGTKWIEFS